MSDTWLTPALLGIDRPQAIAVDGALGELLAAVATQEDAALSYSVQVGVLAACKRAALPTVASVALLPPAEADPLALPAGHAWGPLLQALFTGAQPPTWMRRARYEACQQLAAHTRHLPIALLPKALEAGARSSALRPALRPVLGSRGRWLAACNADWNYAVEATEGPTAVVDLEQVWNEGGADARLLAFRQLRAHNAPDASTRLQGRLKDLSARERVDFIAALQPQLGDADAPLLQPLLKDRSREVRMLVGPMLARLASTAHAHYIQAQMLRFLQRQPGGLLRRMSWKLDAPTAADDSWADAAIDSKRPNGDMLGERAWWLYQVTRQLPLAWWCHTLEKPPVQVLAWARTTDWYDALLRAWLERVDASEPDWVEALIGLDQRHMSLSDLLAMLPSAQRERHWPTNAAELQQTQVFGDVLASTGLGETLSAAYSQQLAPGLGLLFGSASLRHDYALRDALLELLAVLHPCALSLVQVVDVAADATDAMRDCVQQARQLLALRQTLQSIS